MNPFRLFARKKDDDPEEEMSEFDLEEDEEEVVGAVDEQPESLDDSEQKAPEPAADLVDSQDGSSGETPPAESEEQKEDSLLDLFQEETKESYLPDFIWQELQEVETSDLLKECMRVRVRLARRN